MNIYTYILPVYTTTNGSSDRVVVEEDSETPGDQVLGDLLVYICGNTLPGYKDIYGNKAMYIHGNTTRMYVWY